MCRHDVAPRSLSAPPGTPCTECKHWMHTQLTAETAEPDWLRWLKTLLGSGVLPDSGPPGPEPRCGGERAIAPAQSGRESN